MEQREITDPEGTTWVCVQAYAGLEGESADKAAALTETHDHKVPVVCTPRGGAQSVRIQLPVNWLEQLTDEELQQTIISAQ